MDLIQAIQACRSNRLSELGIRICRKRPVEVVTNNTRNYTGNAAELVLTAAGEVVFNSDTWPDLSNEAPSRLNGRNIH